jgi:uncharacterized protein (DUF362 family)
VKKGQAMSKVIIVKGKNLLSSTGDIRNETLLRMLRKGISLMSAPKKSHEFLGTLFQKRDSVGIKINTIAGRMLSTRPEVTQSLAAILAEQTVSSDDIIVWDRTNRELKEAGYRLSMGSTGVKVFGTDARGIGYDPDLESHLSIGSRFSSIQTSVTASISLAILKDHGLAGITAGMKNYFGAIHNPNKYHDSNCNPFVAEVFDCSLIKSRHKFSILDALIVQFHRGPSYHSRWAAKVESLIFSTDPVAADAVGWKIIERLRTAEGLPSLKEEDREPLYIFAAEKMGLGTADPKAIEIIEEEV